MQDIRGKRLLLLGSNVYKELIKQIADTYGIKLIFAGLYPGELDEIADEVYRIDTTDANVMIPFIRSHQIDGVYMGASEFIISSVCDYINEIGLPCICNSEQWKILQNKRTFKQLCKKFDLPITPDYEYQKDKILSYPVIVKPVDGCGSEGLYECSSFEEIEDAYKKAQLCSKTQEVIIEKKIKNDAIYVYYTMTNGRISLDLTEDTHGVSEENGSFTKSIYFAPSSFEKEFILLYDNKIRSMISSIGLQNGDIWFEVFHSEGKYYFNESGFRPAGHKSMYPVQYFSNINQIASLIYYNLTGVGERLTYPRLYSTDYKAENYCIYPLHGKRGIIKDIMIDRELYIHPNIIVISIQRHSGDNIQNDKDFHSIIGFVHFVFNTKNECINLIDMIHEKIKITDCKDCNIIDNKFDRTLLALYK